MKKLLLMLLMSIIFVVGCSDKKVAPGEIDDSVDEIEEFDATISGVISPEKYQKSEKSFPVNSGKEVLNVISTWNPQGARVLFGFIDAKTGEEFWGPPQKSGSWNGSITTSDLKVGQYYIAAKTEAEINDFDKEDRVIIAHFNWK